MHVLSSRVPASRNKFLFLFVVCGGSLLLLSIRIVTVGVGLFRSSSADIQQAGIVADRFLTALEKQDKQATIETLIAHNRNDKMLEGLQDIMSVLEKLHGLPIRHRHLPSFLVGTDNGVFYVRLDYQETFEKGEVFVQIKLVSEKGKWLVRTFDFRP